ncbi:MAG: HEAT repeat domain-containing protein [Myxococcota bacterium]|nr:HEAT repeat domain-containing protein [Myxococcota bacterium]
MHWKMAAGVLAVCTLLASASVEAQRRRRGNPELDAAVEQLGADDRDQVRAGLETLGLMGDPGAVAPISERIRRGLPPDLLDIAVDTLTILGRAEAGPILFELARHRRAGIRLKAVQGVVATRPRGAARVLVAALSDTDETVRAAAAEGLGTLGAREGIDDLFHALDRRVPNAAMAIGQLARPAEVDRFLGYLGQLPFDQVTPALSEILHRDDLAERAKLAVVHRLTELATPEVRTFLEDYVSGLDPDDRSQVRRAAEDAIPRIGQ